MESITSTYCIQLTLDVGGTLWHLGLSALESCAVFFFEVDFFRSLQPGALKFPFSKASCKFIIFLWTRIKSVL